MTPWWTGQEAGLFGGIGGSVIGILGGVLGTMAGTLAPRGKARGLVVGSFVVCIVAGVVILTIGLVALGGGQPYHVWYPLILSGGILTLVLGCLFPVLRIRYRQAEARRLEAEELRRA